MTRFILMTGPRHPGAVLYVGFTPGSRNGFEIVSRRDKAFVFDNKTSAMVVARRFSTLYGLVTKEVEK